MKTMSMFLNEDDLLKSILDEMDLPDARRYDYFWLVRNMQFNNREHEDFPVAIALVEKKIKELEKAKY